MSKKKSWLPGFIGISAVICLVAARFVFYYFKSDGFSGLSMAFPLLAAGILISAVLMSVFFAAWVYQDCKKRMDDGVLWAVITFIATPFIGLLVYLLRRREVKQRCAACGHAVSRKANFCEACGSKLEQMEGRKDMEFKQTHHIHYIIAGTISMVLMLACLASFIAGALSGKGINTDAASDSQIWNLGGISMNYQSMNDGVWTLNFRSASDGFIAQKDMTIHDAGTETLYADVSCGTVPDDSSLTLYLVQGNTVESFDVTNLSRPLEYPLHAFQNGSVHVRLLIEGVKDTVSKITIR